MVFSCPLFQKLVLLFDETFFYRKKFRLRETDSYIRSKKFINLNENIQSNLHIIYQLNNSELESKSQLLLLRKKSSNYNLSQRYNS